MHTHTVHIYNVYIYTQVHVQIHNTHTHTHAEQSIKGAAPPARGVALFTLMLNVRTVLTDIFYCQTDAT